MNIYYVVEQFFISTLNFTASASSLFQKELNKLIILKQSMQIALDAGLEEGVFHILLLHFKGTWVLDEASNESKSKELAVATDKGVVDTLVHIQICEDPHVKEWFVSRD